MSGSTLHRVVASVAVAVILTACGAGSEPPNASPSASASVSAAASPNATAPVPVPVPTPAPQPSPSTPSPTHTTPPGPPPTPALPAGLAGRIVTALPTSSKVVALTFDGGASDTGVPSILQTLAAQQVPATFFVTGDFARRYPDRVRAMAAAGHVVANHSDTHPDFTTLSAAAQSEQLAAAESVIHPLSARSTEPWFRFPYGASNAAAIGTVNAEGYACIGWTVDTLGWKGTSGGQSTDTVVSRIAATAQPGQIVLMHVGANPDDGTTLDADALPTIIDRLRAMGYGFVTLEAAR